MYLHLPVLAGLVGVIASSLPLAVAHEIHLPYRPLIGAEIQPDAYLSLNWSIINGTLYANNDRVFPPSMSMQLRAPRHEGPPKILIQQEEVEVSYAIAARPLSTEENGSSSSIVRIRVTLLSPEGKPVTPDTVVLDLLSPPDGSHHITRVRLEPTKCHRGNHRHGHRPWQMKFWRAQMNALLKGLQNKQASSLGSVAEHDVKQSNAQNPADSPDSASDSQTGFISSPYWSPTYSRLSDQQTSGTFMRLVRPVILPALLGTAASLVACLIGFVIGQLFMAISMRLGFRKKQEQRRRSRMIAVEEGTFSEKAQLVPTIYVTETDTDGLCKGTAF